MENLTHETLDQSGMLSFPQGIETSNEVIRGRANALSAKAVIYLKNAKVLLQNEEPNLALQLLRQASNLHSTHPDVLKSLGEVLEQQKKWDEAYKVYQKLCHVQPNFFSFYKKAEVEYILEKDDLSLQTYFEALAHLTEDCAELFSVYKNMGNILVRQKDFDGAEEYYNKAYSKNPDSDTLFVNFGTLEIQREDFNKAITCFRQAIQLNDCNDKAWIGLAFVHFRFGDQELSWGNLMKAMDLNPTNKTAVQFMMNWMEDKSKEEEIKTRLANYLEQQAFDEDVNLYFIQMLVRSGQTNEAIQCAQLLRLQNPENQKYSLLINEFRKGVSSNESAVEI